ncbi:MAG: DNRLRE domain-containing protein [Phycisphaerales bacterium]
MPKFAGPRSIALLLAAAATASANAQTTPPRWHTAPPAPETPDPGSTNTFRVVALPDTQNYSEFYPEIFRSQTSWVLQNRENLNIRFMSTLGDVVNHGDRLNEWANSRTALDPVLAADLPHSITVGNHDVTPAGQPGSTYNPSNYLANYGPQRFAGRSWYKGASPSGMSNYQTFRAGGREFLQLSLSIETPYEELVWAQGVLNANRDKPVFLSTHRYLQDAEDYTAGVPLVPSGRYPSVWYGVEGNYNPSGIQSEEFFQNFVRMQKNLFMVQCGHFHEEFRQSSTAINGNVIHEVLADYQDDPNGGDGFLRVMEFNMAANRIDVQSYSTTRNEYRTADESQFSLNVQWDRYSTGAGRKAAVFTQGVGGYAGTRDTWISEANGNTSYGGSDRIVVDDDVNNNIFTDRRGQGLLRFDEILTANNEVGKVPMGSVIESAELRFHVPDDIDTPFYNPVFYVYMLNVPWTEASTWNSLGGGLSGGELGTLLGSFLGDNVPDGETLRLINVTAALQAWANGAPNYGFAILPQIISGNDDGIELWSSSAGNVLLRPTLDVVYRTGLIPAPGVLAAFAGAGMIAARRRRSC